jgi:hypothetical protein
VTLGLLTWTELDINGKIKDEGPLLQANIVNTRRLDATSVKKESCGA